MRDGPAIEVSQLVKTFGKVVALDHVDLAVPVGSVCGILGPNGAGKSTLTRILATLARPGAGVARVLGHDVVADADGVRACISLTGQGSSVDEDLTGLENLVLLGRLLGLRRRAAKERAVDLLEGFELLEAAGRPVKQWSGGMRRRLDLAASVVVSPEVLFLDEPTTGLDPRSRLQVWDIVRHLVAQGTTVLLTTQYLEEADRLADHVAVIDRGRVVAEGTPAQLKAATGSGTLRLRLSEPAQRERAEARLHDQLGVPVLRAADPTALTAAVADPARAAAAVADLAASGIDVAEFALHQPSLDEVFLGLTGQPVERGKEVA